MISPETLLADDIEWKVMQAYANHWLKWGAQNEAEQLERTRHERLNYFRQSVEGRKTANESGIRMIKQREIRK